MKARKHVDDKQSSKRTQRKKKARKPVTPDTRLPIALRSIEGNLTFTADSVIAWFVLETQRWAFQPTSTRDALVDNVARALSRLDGHRCFIRVTARPYPAAVWAENLDKRTPKPLTSKKGPTWGNVLHSTQESLNKSRLDDKEVYLGVRIDGRGTLDKVVSAMSRRGNDREITRLNEKIALVTEYVSAAGLGARPATAKEIEWLMHRSVAPGIPAPLRLSAVEDGHWDTDDLHAFTDPVRYDKSLFGKSVKVVAHRDGADPITRYVSVLTIGRMDQVTTDRGNDPWMQRTDRLAFPVEWMSTFDVVPGVVANKQIAAKRRVIRDQQKEYAAHGMDVPIDLGVKAARSQEIEYEMLEGTAAEATRVHGWHRIIVSAQDEKTLDAYVRQVQELYKPYQIDVIRTAGQWELLQELIPGQPLGASSYTRRMPVRMYSAGMPHVTARVGDRKGVYLGYTSGSARRAFMFDHWYSTEDLGGPGLVPLVGSLGAGKSTILGSLTYWAVKRGVQSTVLDPSGPLARLCELDDLAEHATHLDLLKADPGTLNPYWVIAQPDKAYFVRTDEETGREETDFEAYRDAVKFAEADRKELVTDVVRMLLPPSTIADPRTTDVVGDAIRKVGGGHDNSLDDVIQALEQSPEQTGMGERIANRLKDARELPAARLFFSGGNLARVSQDRSLLLVITLAGLQLPDTKSDPNMWSSGQRLAVPLLHLATYYTTRRIYGRPMQERKFVGLDEVGQLADWGSGKSLFTRLATDSRKWNVCAAVSSQNPAHVLGLDIANFISSAFVGYIKDESIAREALDKILGVQTGIGYEEVLQKLSYAARSGATVNGKDPRYAPRQFIVRDAHNQVERVTIDLSPTPHLLDALDTNAARQVKAEPAKINGEGVLV